MEDGKPILSRKAFLSIHKDATWECPWPKAAGSFGLLEVRPHNRLPSPDYIMLEMTVPHLVQMCSYDTLDLAQIL